MEDPRRLSTRHRGSGILNKLRAPGGTEVEVHLPDVHASKWKDDGDHFVHHVATPSRVRREEGALHSRGGLSWTAPALKTGATGDTLADDVSPTSKLKRCLMTGGEFDELAEEWVPVFSQSLVRIPSPRIFTCIFPGSHLLVRISCHSLLCNCVESRCVECVECVKDSVEIVLEDT